MIKFIKELFASSSNFFHEQYSVIVEGKKNMDAMLQIWGYEPSERIHYQNAFDYFVRNPEHYDGASMTEDLYDIPGLDIDAMLHDYLYVGMNASANLKFMWLADKLIRSEMRRRGKSSWNTGYRFVALVLKTPFFLPWCYFVKKRRMTIGQKQRFKSIFRMLYREEKIWYKEFQGEISWFVILVLFLVGYIIRTDLLRHLLIF